MQRGLILLLPALVTGVIGGLLTIDAHQGDAAFLFDQENPRTAQPRQFEIVIAKTREPLPTGPGAPGTGAHCIPGTEGAKRNPWRCTVRYGSGRKITYHLKVAPDGTFRGAARDGTRVVTGCCITGGGAPSG